MKLTVIFILLFFLVSFEIQSQNKVFISGQVIDSKGSPISQSLVVAEGTSIGTYSDDDGFYSLELPRGNYNILVSAFGFKDEKKEIKIFESQTCNFTLLEQAVNLLEVRIYGKAKEQQLRESSLTVNSLNVKNQASSLSNLNALIAKSSGVRVRENGGVGSDFDLSINGLSGNSVRYFVDGIPLIAMGTGISLANIPVSIVDRIDVYKGVVPTFLGSDALGGAVNIVTKKSVSKYLDFSSSIGSFNTYRSELNAQYLDSKSNIFIRPSIGIEYSKNNYTMKHVEVYDKIDQTYKKKNEKRFHDDYYSFVSQLNTGISNKKWADLFSISTSYSYIDKELQTGAVQKVVYGKAKRENKSFNLSSQYQKKNFMVDDLSVNLFVAHTWDNTTVIDTAFRQYRWDGSYTETSRNEITGRGRSIRKIKRPLTVFRSNFNYSINEHNALNFNYLLEALNNKRKDKIDKGFVPTKDLFNKHSFGFSYNQNFLEERLINSFFIKDYLSHVEIGQQDLYWITGSDKVKKNKTTNNWGYGLSSRYRFYSWFSLKGSFEHTMRLPLARELLGSGTDIYPNFAIKPETSDNLNIGLFGSIDIAMGHSLYYEGGFFHRKVKDLIHFSPNIDGTGQYDNVNDVTIKGLEGELRYDYNNMIQVVANITYQNERNKTRNGSDGKPDITYNDRVPNKPWLYNNLEVNFRKENLFGQKENQLKVAYSYQYVHSFYHTWKAYAVSKTKPFVPSQYLNSANLTYSIKKEKYNISVECNNIFDRLIYDNYMLQKPGRAFWAKFRVFVN